MGTEFRTGSDYRWEVRSMHRYVSVLGDLELVLIVNILQTLSDVHLD